MSPEVNKYITDSDQLGHLQRSFIKNPAFPKIHGKSAYRSHRPIRSILRNRFSELEKKVTKEREQLSYHLMYVFCVSVCWYVTKAEAGVDRVTIAGGYTYASWKTHRSVCTVCFKEPLKSATTGLAA